MLQVKASARPSRLHNIGLFADEFIPKGTIVWKFDLDFDIVFDPAEVEAMSAPKKAFLEYWPYVSKKSGKLVCSIDDSRFTNHSKNHNLDQIEMDGEMETVSIANRDIQEGEELLEDYRSFDEVEASSDAAFLDS